MPRFKDPKDGSIWTSNKPLIRDIKGNTLAYVTNGKQSQWIKVSNPKNVDDEAMKQAKARDNANIRVQAADDLTDGLANIITGGQSSILKDGAQNIKNGNYIQGVSQLASPAMFGSGLVGNIARAGIGGYNLVNKDGIQKTAKYINNGQYSKAVASGAGDLLNAGMAFHGGSQLFKNSKLLRTNNVVNYMEGPTKRQNIRDFKRSILEIEDRKGTVGKIFNNPDVRHLQRNAYRELEFLPKYEGVNQDYRQLLKQAVFNNDASLINKAEESVLNNTVFKNISNREETLNGVNRIKQALWSANRPKLYQYQGFSDMPYPKKKAWMLDDSMNPRGMVHRDLNKIYIADPSNYGKEAVPLHEGEHVYQNIMEHTTGSAYTKPQEQLLNSVYITDANSLTKAYPGAINIQEKGAFNKEVLKNMENQYIEQFGRQPNYLELNQYIDKSTPSQLFKALKTNTSKYKYRYLDNIDYVWDNPNFNKQKWINNFKRALKYAPVTVPVMFNKNN